MRTTLKTALLLAVLTASLLLHASNTPIIIGNYNDGNCYPFMCSDSGTNTGQTMDYQQVYDYSSFTGPTAIKSLTFYFASAFGGSTNVLGGSYGVYLSSTSAAVGSINGLDPNLVANRGADWTLFAAFSGGADVSVGRAFYGTTFNYTPAKGNNLLLEVIATNQDNVPGGTTNGYMEADDNGTVTSRAYVIGTGTTATGIDSIGLVTGINVPEPGSIALFGSGLAGMAGLLRRKIRL